MSLGKFTPALLIRAFSFPCFCLNSADKLPYGVGIVQVESHRFDASRDITREFGGHFLRGGEVTASDDHRGTLLGKLLTAERIGKWNCSVPCIMSE